MVVEKPIPYKEEIIKKDTIPMYIYIPADTVFLHRVDSVLIEIPVEIEKREYKDPKYKAIISGAKIGDIRPTLDYIETYNVTTTTTMMVEPKKIRPYIGTSVGVFGTWSVGIGGGLFIKDHHAVGAEYERTQTDNRFKVKYSYIF
jgi:hypothetical protein